MDSLPSTEPAEPTLGRALRSIAGAQLPTRFYQILQLGLPAAAQFWIWGMVRTSGWAVVIAAFGAWALFEQRLQAEAMFSDDIPNLGQPAPHRWVRTGRAISAALGAVLALGLTLELFARVVNPVLQCLGCAG